MYNEETCQGIRVEVRDLRKSQMRNDSGLYQDGISGLQANGFRVHFRG